MAHVVNMPRMGEGMEEGQIMSWFIKEGDSVIKGEPLFELMTDKSLMEFPAPTSGVLLKVLVQNEEYYDCGTPVCIIGEENEDISSLL